MNAASIEEIETMLRSFPTAMAINQEKIIIEMIMALDEAKILGNLRKFSNLLAELMVSVDIRWSQTPIEDRPTYLRLSEFLSHLAASTDSPWKAGLVDFARTFSQFYESPSNHDPHDRPA